MRDIDAQNQSKRKTVFSFFFQNVEIVHMHEENHWFWDAGFVKCDFDDIFGAYCSRKTRINDYGIKN